MMIYAAVALALAALWSLHDYRRTRSDLVTARKEEARKLAVTVSGKIQYELKNMMGSAESLARVLASGPAARSTIERRLYKTIETQPEIHSIGVAFAPFAFAPDVRLYSVAFTAAGADIARSVLDAGEDYTSDDVSWFNQPTRAGRSMWLRPAADEHGHLCISYAVPFVYVRDQTAGEAQAERPAENGVVIVSYRVERLAALLHSLDLGETGYGYVLSPDGHVLYHPKQEYIDGRTTFLDIVDEMGPGRPGRNDTLRRALTKGRSEVAAVIDPVTGHLSWVLHEPIAPAQWTLGVVLLHDEILRASKHTRRHLIHITLLIAATILALALPISGAHRGRITGLWTVSMVFSVVCIGVLGCVLVLVDRSAHTAREDRTRIPNQAALQRFLRNHDRQSLALHGELPIYVPTGVFVESVVFQSANEVRITGYIWQRYQEGVHDEIEQRGFVMPESQDSTLAAPQVQQRGGETHMVWEFKVTVHQDFDYARFPLGRENVWIQLWHQEFTRNYILVPDLNAYNLTIPSARPGMKEDVSIPGWEIESTYFSYRNRTYETDFGLGDYSGLTSFPELYFNIPVRKQILGAFISHLLPLIVVMLLLFTILMLSTRQEGKVELLGFNTMNVVTACAGFFLVVIFSHIDLREKLAAKGIVYLEHYYFITYAALLLVAVNALLFSGTDNRLLHYANNLIPKLCFWPMVSAALLGLTLYTFY